MESIWRPDIDIFHCDKNEYRKGNDYNLKRIREADIVHLHSNGVCPLYQHYFMDNPQSWIELLSSRMRLSVIRNPISKFESEWGSYVERKNSKMVSHVPNFDFDVLSNDSKSLREGFGGWHGQSELERIDINEMMEIYCDINRGDLPNIKFGVDSILQQIKTGKANLHFHATVSDALAQNSIKIFSFRNKQYHMIAANIATDFLFNPRSSFQEDILLVNENLDRCLAALVTKNENIKALTIFKDQSISYSEALQEIQKLRTHSRSNKFKSDTFSLNSKNRIKFFLYNRIDFSIWQSAAVSSSRWIRSISS